MRLDWVNILATVIFVSIVVTLILAVASYFAYKVREARRPKTAAELRREGKNKTFFEEYRPGPSAAATRSESGARESAPLNASSKR
jgi:hypothetical protein